MAAQAQVSSPASGHVSVAGELTFATARGTCEAGIACFGRDAAQQIVVDCQGVSRADSAGLAVLIEWRRWSREHGRHLTFVNLPAQISAIARLSEVTEVLADTAA